MAKKSKLFHAFTGDAVGLRNVLIEHFKSEYDRLNTMQTKTSTDPWNHGMAAAYFDVIKFLKKLVINNDEHSDDLGTDGSPEHMPSQQQKQDE